MIFFERYPQWQHLYRNRILAVCLCQGAALHYVDGTNGVKDFDVWTFYAMQPEAPFPWRRRSTKDFGISKFGKHPKDTRYLGRRVDLFGRAIDRERREEPVQAIQRYLRLEYTESARRLAMKPVVVIDPEAQRGKIIWPWSLEGEKLFGEPDIDVPDKGDSRAN
jgi:hypothetical protein